MLRKTVSLYDIRLSTVLYKLIILQKHLNSNADSFDLAFFKLDVNIHFPI